MTIDPPELVRFIKKHHPDVKWNNPDMHLWTRMVEKEAIHPARNMRWCCRHYKEKYGVGRKKLIGVRIDESKSRAKRWSLLTPDRKGKTTFLAPICYWTAADVWAFINDRSIPYCSLYDEGFTRLGCIGCPLASASERAKQFERWPSYEKGWLRTFQRTWSKWKSVPTKNGDERYYNWDSPEAWFDYWKKEKDDRVNPDQCVFVEMMEQV